MVGNYICVDISARGSQGGIHMVKIGVIGCGKIAQTRHLPEYATNPHAKLVGYYDKIRERSVQMAEL